MAESNYVEGEYKDDIIKGVEKHLTEILPDWTRNKIVVITVINNAYYATNK